MARHIAGVVDGALQEIALYGAAVGRTITVGYGSDLLSTISDGRFSKTTERVAQTIWEEWDAGVPVEQCAFLVASLIQRRSEIDG